MLSHAAIQKACHQIKVPAKVTKVDSQDPFEFTLQLGKNALLISVEKGLARLHLITKPQIVSNKPFWFAKELSQLKGKTLNAINCDQNIVTLSFDANLHLVCELTEHPQAYLLDEKNRCLKSTNKKALPIYTYPQSRHRTEDQVSPDDIETWANVEKEEKRLQKEKEALGKILVKKIASFDKAIQKAEHSLEKSVSYKDAAHSAELVKAHYRLLEKGMSQLKVSDWEKDNQEVVINIDPSQSPKEVLESLFTKSQKLQRAIVPLKDLIQNLSQERLHWTIALQDLEKISSMQMLESLKQSLHLMPKEVKKKAVIKKAPYHAYQSKKGIEILVGKSSESNHLLTFHVAHGSDLWLHAHSVSGAHVIVRKHKDQEVDADTLQDALQLALYHSKARAQKLGHHEVLVTEQKFVSRTANMPKGKVFVSKHKIMNCVLDLDRIKKLKKE